MQILIAGGGIGGLTAALCLVRRGYTVRVMEQATAFTEIGAGIQLSPNAMKVMQALGLEPALVKAAFQPESLDIRLGRSGTLLLSIPAGRVVEQTYGAPYLNIHRADLMRVLVDALHALDPNVLRPGNQVTGYENTGSSVIVKFADGTTGECDALIGADGIRSTVREAMHGPDDPKFTGFVAWRTIVHAAAVPKDLMPPTASVWADRNRHVVTYYVRGGDLINVVGVVKQGDWQDESWVTPGRRRDMLAAFDGFDDRITTLIEAGSDFHLWGLFDRPPLKRWTDDRVALLGDAAHPMLPFMAQGAAMAIEDAFVLAEELANNASQPDQDLSRYADARRDRTKLVRLKSSQNGNGFHLLHESKLLRALFFVIRRLTTPRNLSNAQKWLYGHDVTRQ